MSHFHIHPNKFAPSQREKPRRSGFASGAPAGASVSGAVVAPEIRSPKAVA
jgi:hypothetical protein